MKTPFTTLIAAAMTLAPMMPASAAQQVLSGAPVDPAIAATFSRADQNFTELYARSAAAGTPGTVNRSGSGVPANTLGIDGDFYLNTATGDLYQRASGAYAIVGNLKGPAGAAGATGAQGPTGPVTTLPLKATASLGVIGGGTWIPDTFFTGSTLNEASISAHTLYDTTSTPVIGVAGFSVSGAGPETAFTGTNTVQVAVEYPAGTCTQVPVGGSVAPAVVPNGGLLYTDSSGWTLPTPTYPGATVRIRLYWVGTTGVPFKTGVPVNQDNGTRLTYGTTGSPAANTTIPTNGQTSGPCPTGVDTNGSGPGTRSAGVSNGFVMAPAIILGNTRVQSIGEIGDSLGAGYKSSMIGSSLDYGVICRAVGKWGPCLNLSTASDAMTSFMTAGRATNRLAMLAYVSHIVVEYGANDISNGSLQTGAGLFTLQQQFKALFPSVPVHLTTITPKSSTASLAVSSLTSTGTAATATVASTAGLQVNGPVTIAGATSAAPNNYNGSFTITALTPTTISYTMSAAAGAPTAGGTITYTDAFSTIANQTASPQCLAQVPTYNNLVRQSPSNGFASYFDVGNQFSSGVDTCKWAVSPYAAPVNPSDDGVHDLGAMVDLTTDRGILLPSRF